MLTEGKVRSIAAQVAVAIAGKIKPTVSDEQIRSDVEKVIRQMKEAGELTGSPITEAIEPAATDLPRIFFTGRFPKDKLNDGELPVEMTYISKTERFFAYATAKVQGSSSTTFAKKNFTFKLFENEARTEKKKVAFRNWPAKNKFVAKANTIDRTHARNVVSARIWGDMARSRAGYDDLPAELRESPNMGAIDGFPVQIYLNGVYQGLYTWNFGKEDWMAGLDEDNANHIMVCAEGVGTVPQITFNEAYTDKTAIFNGYDWEVEVGKKNDTIQTNYKALHDLVVSGTDEDFRANLSTYLNIESFIDNYIFVWLACGVDSLGKNQLLYTYNAGLPWYSGVYDLDSTWGLHPEGRLQYSYDTVMQDGYIVQTGNNTYNRLYQRFWSLFQDQIRARWNKVKHSALSLANIINHFEAFHDAIPLELFAEDSAATTANGEFVTSGTFKGFDKVTADHTVSNIQQIRNFAAARWAYVDSQINFIACTGISLSPDTLTFTEAGQAELTAVLNEGCNEAITWTSDNEEVATVGANGYGKATVTAIYNGSCVITATCGAYSATCTVSVSGFEEAMSTNLAGADGLGGDLVMGKAIISRTVTDEEKGFYTPAYPYVEGDIYYVYGYEPRYIGSGYSKVTFYKDDQSLENSPGERPLNLATYSDGPTRSAGSKTIYTYKITMTFDTTPPSGSTHFRFTGKFYADGIDDYRDYTGGVVIIQRNEPITEETLRKYEAMVAASAEA